MTKHPAERAADFFCTLVIIAAVVYFGLHILAAWQRGSFEVIR